MAAKRSLYDGSRQSFYPGRRAGSSSSGHHCPYRRLQGEGAAQRVTVPWGRVLIHLGAVVVVLIAWYVITLFTPKYVFPTPQAVWEEMWQILSSGDLWPQLTATLQRTVYALIGAMVIGTALGIVMGINSYWESFTRNWVYMALDAGRRLGDLCVLWFRTSTRPRCSSPWSSSSPTSRSTCSRV